MREREEFFFHFVLFEGRERGKKKKRGGRLFFFFVRSQPRDAVFFLSSSGKKKPEKKILPQTTPPAPRASSSTRPPGASSATSGSTRPSPGPFLRSPCTAAAPWRRTRCTCSTVLRVLREKEKEKRERGRETEKRETNRLTHTTKTTEKPKQNGKNTQTGAPGLEGAHEVIGGVYAGGLPSANSLVSSGGAAAGAFRLLSGYAGWEPGQLAAEAERGAWHVVAASTAVVLDAVQGERDFFFFFLSFLSFFPLCFFLSFSRFFFSSSVFSSVLFNPHLTPLLSLFSLFSPPSLIQNHKGRLRDAHGTREKVGTWASIMALAGIELEAGLGSFDSQQRNGGGGPGSPPPSSDKKRRGRAQGPSAFD